MLEKIKQKNKEKLYKQIDEYVVERDMYNKLYDIDKNERLNYLQEERKAWASDRKEVIQAFYKKILNRVKTDRLDQLNRSEFWAVVDDSFTKTHFPLPGIIMNYMSTLLFKEMPVISCEDKEVEDLIMETMEDNNWAQLFQRGAQCESYSGTIAAKIIMDTEFSNYPILQIYPAERIRLNTKYGKVFEIIFLDYYKTDDGRDATLESIYGKGYITYRLIDGKNNKEIPLTDVSELSNLKTTVIINPSTGEPIQHMLAAYKVNKGSEYETIDSPYGASDFSSLIDIFQDIDEAVSSRADLIRKAHIKTFMSEALTKVELMSNGRQINIKPTEWDAAYTVLYDNSPNPESEPIFKRDYLDVKLQEYTNTINELLKTALNRAGISTNSVLENAAGANASAEALKVREGISANTRAIKVELWTKFIKDISDIIQIFYNIDYYNEKSNEEEIYYIFKGEEIKNISVIFPDFYKDTFEDKLYKAQTLLESGLGNKEDALKILYPDLSDEEVENKIVQQDNKLLQEVNNGE